MYIYRKGEEEFASVDTLVCGFYKFWPGEISEDNSFVYSKPMETLPEIDWEIDLSPDEWRQRVLMSDPDAGFTMGLLRNIPDRYITAAAFNLLYDKGMSYDSDASNFMPIRNGDTFLLSPYSYPGIYFIVIGLSTLVEEYRTENTPQSHGKANVLMKMLRHLNYVLYAITKVYGKIVPEERVLIATMDAVKSSVSATTLYYDSGQLRKWKKLGGSLDLMVAGYCLRGYTPTDEAILKEKDEILAEWAKLTDFTVSE